MRIRALCSEGCSCRLMFMTASNHGLMDVFEAMRKRRMYRQFLWEPVSEDVVEQLVYAAGRAPTSRSGIRHFVVVTDRATVEAIRMVAPGFRNDAPALIAICADLHAATEWFGETADDWCALDAGASGGYLSLAAPALGIGICWVASWRPPAIQAVLELPDHIKPYLLVAIGRPAPTAAKAPRRFEPTVHRDRFAE